MTRHRAVGVFAVGLAGMLALAGCAPGHGTVYDKRHTAASTSYRTSCSGHGSHRHCRRRPVHHSEKWQLCLRDGKKTGCKSVSAATYARYDVGQQYP